MKRLAGLLLVVMLSFSTVGFRPPAPPSAVPETRNRNCHNVRLVRICASVSEGSVLPGSYVTIYGSMRLKGVGVPGQIMRVVWSSKTTLTCLGVTDANGDASCTTYVPSTIKGSRTVNVKVWLDKYKITTHFRIKNSVRDRDSDE